MKQSFQDILKDCMTKSTPPSKETSGHSEKPLYNESPLGLGGIESLVSRLATQVKPSRFTAQLSFCYEPTPLPERPSTTQKAKPPKPSEKTLLKKDLTPQQLHALNIMIKLGCDLKEIELIGERRLKSAYRQAALQLHPDRKLATSSTEEFRTLTLAYKTLLRAFKSY